MVKKCKMCGAEITRTDREVFCSQQCAYDYKNIEVSLKRSLKRIGKKYGFEVENLKKVVNAKMMLFGRYHEDVKRCPCDADNPERYCGSVRCIADVVNDGHCHCNLFHRPKSF